MSQSYDSTLTMGFTSGFSKSGKFGVSKSHKNLVLLAKLECQYVLVLKGHGPIFSTFLQTFFEILVSKDCSNFSHYPLKFQGRNMFHFGDVSENVLSYGNHT